MSSSTRAQLVEELLNAPDLEKLLRDSYCNYVIQTALDYSDPRTRRRLVEKIRPILPAIRTTPYGRRIQSKLSHETSRVLEVSPHGHPQLSSLRNPGYGLLNSHTPMHMQYPPAFGPEYNAFQYLA